MKTKIHNQLINRKSRSYSDRDERVNHIISECSKLAQKEYKSKYDWVG